MEAGLGPAADLAAAQKQVATNGAEFEVLTRVQSLGVGHAAPTEFLPGFP